MIPSKLALPPFPSLVLAEGGPTGNSLFKRIEELLGVKVFPPPPALRQIGGSARYGADPS